MGIQIGNYVASPSWKTYNLNVLFSQDFYFKFGTTTPFIESDSTDFLKTMPFVLSHQGYDYLKKYRERINEGAKFINGIDETIQKLGG